MPTGATHVGEQSDEERRHLAVTVGRFLLNENKHDDRREAIENLARLLSHDASVAVREALAQEVKVCEFLPRDVAERIARDVEDVSIPFITESPVLSDEFLTELVEICSEAVRAVVAGRAGLSEPVGLAITEFGSSGSVATLMENHDAAVTEKICAAVCNQHSDDQEILQSMSERSDLTLIIVDRLVAHMSAYACEKLVAKYGLARDYASYLESQTRRHAIRATFASASDAEVEAYLSRLHRMDDLGPDILLHFLSEGEIRFFRIALGVRSCIPEENISLLLSEGGSVGLDGLLEKCGFKGAVLRLIRVQYFECLAKENRTVTSRAIRP